MGYATLLEQIKAVCAWNSLSMKFCLEVRIGRAITLSVEIGTC